MTDSMTLRDMIEAARTLGGPAQVAAIVDASASSDVPGVTALLVAALDEPDDEEREDILLEALDLLAGWSQA